MFQPATNSQLQGQLKKTSSRSKPQEAICVNDKGKKNVPIPGARKPVKVYNKQATSGGREKVFSKNERKIPCSDSRHYLEKNTNSYARTEAFAVQNLLNFQYASSRDVESNNSRRYQFSRRKKTYFNKEEYLQARCQFVVIGTPDDYAINAVDPDKLVDWNQIYLVYLTSHEPPNCPICLYSPVAAKMTRCGHIFCWSCVLHYLQLGDKAWRKCPICHEAVHKTDLKSVKSYAVKKYERLESITMKLMRRAKDSVFVTPKSESDTAAVEFPSWVGHTSNFGSKVMLATPEEVLQHILMKERDELRAQLDIDIADGNGEDTFISMALQLLEENIKSFKSNGLSEEYVDVGEEEENTGIYDLDGDLTVLSSMLNDNSMGSSVVEAAFSDDEFDDTTNVGSNATPIGISSGGVEHHYFHGRVSNNSESSVSSEPRCGEELQGEDVDRQDEIVVASNVSTEFSRKSYRNSDSYHFYQAEDGQNIFLHSLNARCLIEEYGSLDFGPLKITGQIIDFECYTMTKDLRKRFRYLSHLPLSSEFIICELILKPPLLSKNTIHNFMPEFKSRKASRLRKFREQQKLDRQTSAVVNKQHGFRSLDYEDDDGIGIDLSNTTEFPCGLAPGISPGSTEVVKVGEEKDETATQQFQGPSFAQMLNKKAQDVSPRKENAPVSNVYRSQEPIQTLPPKESRVANDEDDGPEIVAPDFKETFSAAMFAAPLKQENSSASSKGKNGKKKKDKGMLLFATGGQRKY